MGFFDELERTVTEAGHGISRKAKEVAEVTRLKNLLHTQETLIDVKYREIGKLYYEAHKDEAEDVYAVQMRALSEAQAAAAALREQIDSINL